MRLRLSATSSAVLPALVFTAATLHPQGPTGKLEGRVTDATGLTLVEAQVYLVGTAFGAVTDPSVHYFINHIPAGEYDIRAAYIGHRPIQVAGLRILPDQTITQDFALEPVPLQLREIAVVAAENVRLLDSLYRSAVDTSTSAPFALAIELSAPSPATQIRFTQRVLRHGIPPARADGFRTFVPMLWAARGAWDSALALLDETADTDSLYPRGLQSYGLAVLGTWLGAIPPGEACTRRPAAAKAAAVPSTRLARYLTKNSHGSMGSRPSRGGGGTRLGRYVGATLSETA